MLGIWSLLVLLVVSDGLTYLSGGDIVTEFQLDTYREARAERLGRRPERPEEALLDRSRRFAHPVVLQCITSPPVTLIACPVM